MYVTPQRSHGKALLACAVALYFAGALIETLGIALIAAYGSVITGGAIAICGFLVAIVGNRRWPAPEHGLPVVAFVRGHMGDPTKSRQRRATVPLVRAGASPTTGRRLRRASQEVRNVNA
jgi:hypothetical protein